MRNAVHTYLEYALDYAAAGLYEEAARWLDFLPGKEGQTYPMIVYALGYFAHQQGQEEKAAALYRKAETLSPDYCFPNRLEEILILEDAMRLNPEGDRAPYYLGNFWYAARQYEQAVDCWNRSAALDGNFPTVLRNLALANYNKLGRPDEAVRLLEKAFALDSTDARILMELDQLYKKRRVPHRQRLDFLEQHRELVEQRDDLCVERITLYNQLGDYTTACHLLAERKFHPWEGGEGKVTGQFVFAHVEKAKQYLSGKQYEKALHELKLTETYLWVRENSSMPKKMTCTTGWAVPMRAWEIHRKRAAVLNMPPRVRQSRPSPSFTTTSNPIKSSIRDWPGGSLATRPRHGAVSTV